MTDTHQPEVFVSKEVEMRKYTIGLLVAALATVAVTAALQAQAPLAPATTLTVEGMHCPSCAKKIAAKLREVPGVAAVRADVEASTILVSHRQEQAPSPRGVWEAVERAGYRPTQMVTPNGRYTAKPGQTPGK